MQKRDNPPPDADLHSRQRCKEGSSGTEGEAQAMHIACRQSSKLTLCNSKASKHAPGAARRSDHLALKETHKAARAYFQQGRWKQSCCPSEQHRDQHSWCCTQLHGTTLDQNHIKASESCHSVAQQLAETPQVTSEALTCRVCCGGPTRTKPACKLVQVEKPVDGLNTRLLVTLQL